MSSDRYMATANIRDGKARHQILSLYCTSTGRESMNSKPTLEGEWFVLTGACPTAQT